MNGKEAEELLRALGKVLEEQDAKPVDILVCGGMALILQGLVDRRTRDIDGIGLIINYGGSRELRKPLPDSALRDAIERVGRVYGFQKHWLSFQARTLIDDGLPEGIIERAEVRTYGERLTVRLCSRFDMVYLKMWGAAGGRAVDMEDLVEMGTTEEETEAAVAECLAKGCRRSTLISILERIGHGRLAERLA